MFINWLSTLLPHQCFYLFLLVTNKCYTSIEVAMYNHVWVDIRDKKKPAEFHYYKHINYSHVIMMIKWFWLWLWTRYIHYRVGLWCSQREVGEKPENALDIQQLYDSLILSHIQFGITCWGFEWGRLAKLQKRAVRIITNSKYNAHTEPLFKDLHLLKITDIFDVQCMKFWYKFSNNTLPNYFRFMFQYNSSLYETTIECIFFQPEHLVHVTSCDIASQNEFINSRLIW